MTCRTVDIALVELDEAALLASGTALRRSLPWLGAQPSVQLSHGLLDALTAKAYLHRDNHLELRIEGTFGSELVLVVPDGQWSWR